MKSRLKSDLPKRRAQLARARHGAYRTNSAQADALLRIILGTTSEADRRTLMAGCLTMLAPADGQMTIQDLPRGVPLGGEQWDAAWAAIWERTSEFLDVLKGRNDALETVAQRVIDFLASLGSEAERTVAFAYIIKEESGLTPYVQVPDEFLRPAFPRDAGMFRQVLCRPAVQRSAALIRRAFQLAGISTAHNFGVLRTVLTRHEDPVEVEVLISLFHNAVRGSRDSAVVQVIELGGNGVDGGRDGNLRTKIASLAAAYGVSPQLMEMLLWTSALQAGLPVEVLVQAITAGNCGIPRCPFHGTGARKREQPRE